jgi:hypothetical protein
MAVVSLTDLWLHDAADLSDFVTLEVSELVEVPAIEAPIRRYASGVLRMVRSGEVQHSYAVLCRLPSRSAVDQLREWAGQLLMLRDPLGRKRFGRFEEATFRELAMRDTDIVYEVELTFDEITHSEEV